MNDERLDRATQQTVLRLAGEAIRAAVLGRRGPSREEIAEVEGRHPALAEPAGVFVTVYTAGQLRGCLGEIEPEGSLAVVLVRCAQRAPTADYRFAPIEPHELAELSYKVSILTSPVPVSSLGEIHVGVHGLIARHEGHGGLLLPDVATEHGWDLETFLRHLWRKAGIAPTVPQEDVKLWTFTSIILSSEAFAMK